MTVVCRAWLLPLVGLFLGLVLCGKRAGGGIHQRTRDPPPADDITPDPAASGSAGPDRGGIRQRMEPVSSSSRSRTDLPLNAAWRRDWGKGILTSGQIQKYAKLAGNQGAEGARRACGPRRGWKV